MKKYFAGFLGVAILALFIYVGYFLYRKNQADPVVYSTVQPFYADIARKTVANGSLKPRKEIKLKPQISGIIDEIFIEAGNLVEKGQTIARIKVIPDDLNLSNAESNLKKARIAHDEAGREKNRREELFKAGVISEVEFNQYLFEFERREEDLNAAQTMLQLIKDGVAKGQKQTTTLVKATIAGTVLDVPVKEGEQVIQSNNFNDGTTIALVADMTDLIFEGLVDESEVGKIKTGMELKITIGAIEGKFFSALLEYISPKGIEDQGTVQFQIRAAVTETNDAIIRAGYSANADIILESKTNVLAINERELLFDNGKSFVEIETSDQQFERREVKTGISDGINVEILEGLSENERVKFLGTEAEKPVKGDKGGTVATVASGERLKKSEVADGMDTIVGQNESPEKVFSESKIEQADTRERAAIDEKQPIIHQVKNDETLYRIAMQYRVAVENIKKWNNLENNQIIPGSELIVGFE